MGFGGKRLGGCVRAYLVGAQKEIARACVCVSVREGERWVVVQGSRKVSTKPG